MEIQLSLANRNTNIGHWLKPPPSPQLNLIKGLRVQVSDLQAARHIFLEMFFMLVSLYIVSPNPLIPLVFMVLGLV